LELRLLTDAAYAEEFDIVVDELTYQYVANEFQGEERGRMEQHFFKSADRRNKLKFALALEARTREVASDRERKKPFFRSYLAIAASLLIMLGLGLGIWRIFFHQSEVDKGLLALNAAYREQRPVEARISQLNYAPYVTTRGPGDERVDQNELRLAELTLLEASTKNPTPAIHHALGKVYLAKKEFDKAIEQFNEALRADTKNAQLYSDLGAAWLEKGKYDTDRNEQGKSIEEFGRSLENLTKATELNGNLLEARFNRALCYQLMLLPRQAEEEWRVYLKQDSKSPWAEEAKQNLMRLEERKNKASAIQEYLLRDFRTATESKDERTAWLIVSRHRDISGGPIANALIDNYLDLTNRAQREESSKTLEALFYVAKLEQNKAGDLFVRDLAKFLRSSTNAQRQSLVEARHLLKLGWDSLYKSNGQVAERYLVRAKAILEHIGDKAEAVYVDYPIGHSYLMQLESNLSLSVFNQVVRQCETHQYKWLQAQALNATANVQIGLTNLSAALEASDRSLKLSEQIGDTTGVMKTTNQLAQQYFRLGNYSKSLDLHKQSLALAIVSGTEPIQFWRTYFAIPFPLDAMGLHSAAVEYEKEALRWAEDSKVPPVTVCRSYSLLGLMYAGQGNYEEALKNADVAIDRAEKIQDQASKKEAIAYSSLQRGLIQKQSGNFAKAVDDYDQAIELYDELGKFEAFSYVAHKGKLLACMGEGGCPSAKEEIKTCLDLFEQYRSKILEESNREPFFDTEQDIYDVAIDYEFSKKDFQTAFEYSERARARSLLDLASNEAKIIGESRAPDIRFNSATPAKDFAELKAKLPAETQVLQYAVLKDKLVIWLISDTDFIHEEKAVSLADLNKVLFRYLRLVSSPADSTEDLRRDSSALYDILIQPIEVALKKDKLLCVVPDKTLNYLPFGALVSSASGKYLMNEYRLTWAPSVTLFIRSSRLAAEKKKMETESVLTVGNPRFSREQFPQLSDLPSADREARQIKRSYEPSQTRALVGEEATKAMVEGEMKRSNVVHLAVHSIVDEQFPLRSKLILAAGDIRDESDESGVLQAYEIYKSSLPVTRLVVLSSCETGVGRYYRGEGIMGLSRTFIAAGVPLVVASLWPVDSDATADLMIAFHRHRKTENLSTAEALQKAQQDMANGDDQRYRHPYYWAGFTLVGGYAKF
jgi:CHAT domain-containing protein